MNNMLDENNVIEIVCNHLKKQGYEIIQQLHTTQHGIDIIAYFPKDGTKLLIEAKGGTSSRKGSNRYGKPYTASQLFDRVSKGTYTILKLHSENKHDKKVSVGMAFPDLPKVRGLLEPIKTILHDLGIKVFLTKQNNEVIEYL